MKTVDFLREAPRGLARAWIPGADRRIYRPALDGRSTRTCFVVDAAVAAAARTV
jgi:hypothetical protein